MAILNARANSFVAAVLASTARRLYTLNSTPPHVAWPMATLVETSKPNYFPSLDIPIELHSFPNHACIHIILLVYPHDQSPNNDGCCCCCRVGWYCSFHCKAKGPWRERSSLVSDKTKDGYSSSPFRRYWTRLVAPWHQTRWGSNHVVDDQ
jgi:hypothetical protein